MRVFRCVCALLLVPALVGCTRSRHVETTPMGRSDLEVLPPPPQQPVPEGARPVTLIPEISPTTRRQGLPDYPEAALASGAACTAKLLYHIETDGSAKLVRLEWEVPPPAELRPQFEHEIGLAVAGWEFVPATKFFTVKNEAGAERYAPRPVPKAQRAVVRFRVENGRGVVE